MSMPDQIRLRDILLDLQDYDGEDIYNKGPTFINKCDFYFDVVMPSDDDTLIKLIKSKITGRALRKMQPYFDQCLDWNSLKSTLIGLRLV